ASQPATDADRRAAAAAATTVGASGGVLRSRTALKSGPPRTTPTRPKTATAVPRAARSAGPTTGSKAQRPPTRLSPAGLASLQAELEELTTVTRPAIVARIVAARELGDLK